MNKIFKFCLLTIVPCLLINNVNACTKNGFGFSAGFKLSKPRYKVTPKQKLLSQLVYEYMKSLLAKELKNSGVPAETKEIKFTYGSLDNMDLENKANMTYTAFNDILKFDSIKKAYPSVSGNNIDTNILILKNNGDYYIKPSGNNITEKDYVSVSDICDNFVDNNQQIKLNGDDVSRWNWAVDLGVFYNFKIFDWIVRPELDISIPFMNRTVSIPDDKKEKKNNQQDDAKKDNNKSKIDITKSFDVTLKLLGGYHITERFKILFGIGTTYSRYKLKTQLDNSIGSFASNVQQENKIAQEAWTDALNALQTNYDKDKSFGKWNFIGILGLEFNINSKNMINLEVSFGPTKSLIKSNDAKSWGDVTVSNNMTCSVAYKHIF